MPLIAALILTLLAACADAPATQPSANAVELEAAHLPFSGLTWSEAQSKAIFEARQNLVRACMVDAGFTDYPRFGWIDIDLPDKRYGITDPEAARDFGYQVVASSQVEQDQQQAAWSAYWDSLTEDEQVSAEAALSGGQGSLRRVPDTGGDVFVEVEGCNGEAMTRLHGSVDAFLTYEGLRSRLWDLRTEALVLARSDERVVSALKEWSGCMAAHGQNAGDPLELIDRFAEHEEAEAEVAAAVADVSCKQQVDLVPRWSAVEREYQLEALAQDGSAAMMDEFQELDRRLWANADAVLVEENA